jgi:aspartate carbamoyltransferase catalytic subunit
MKQPKNLISINELSKKEIIRILELASDFEKKPSQDKLLKDKVIATAFYEPSTRTRLSFETAISRLGGKIVGFSDISSTSVKKGESLKDTTMMLSNYSDLIILRHPREGSARFSSEISKVPIINAGDGANQHPTQTLLDLYSIKETQKKLSNLNITFVGDLKYGRTVHSLVLALIEFNCKFTFVSPKELKIPSSIILELKSKNIDFIETSDIEKNLAVSDILYMTRIQKERFSEDLEYEKVKNAYVLTNELVSKTKATLKVLHPLPRVDEIEVDVDENPKAHYFKQAENGVYVRQAIITLLLGVKRW